MKFAKLFVLTAMTAVAATAHAQTTVQCNAGGAGSELNLSPTSTCAVTNALTSVVPVVARLTISANTLNLTPPGATAFSNTQAGSTGVTETGPTISVSSNSSYSLTSSSAANWAGGSGNKPASDLLIGVNGGAHNAIGAMPGGAGATNLDTYNLSYKTRYTWTIDTPGTYTLTVNYTLTAP